MSQICLVEGCMNAPAVGLDGFCPDHYVRLVGPLDRSTTSPARKNRGKPRLTKAMLMPTAQHALIKVLEFGEQKYSPAYEKGWLNYDKQEVMDSMMRHASAIINDELIDPESGLPHAAHMLFNAAVYAELSISDDYSFEGSSEQIPLEGCSKN